MKKYKLAVLTSHPIQYQTPFFKKIAFHPEIDLMVYFCCDYGLKEKKDPGFGKFFKWDIPLLDGYKYKFLKNWSPKPQPTFFGQINPIILKELRTNKYDAILVYGWQGLTNWFVFFSKTPIFLRGENPLNQELLKSKWKLKIKKIILSWLFKRINAFLYIGEENKKFYRYYAVPESKLFFSPYAVDNERFIKNKELLAQKRQSLRKKLGVKENDIVVLFVGKLIEKKRPMDLLKAYETIMRNTRMHANIANRNRDENKIVEKELSYVLTGIFFEIHNELGRFARERQYADALEQKLTKKSIKFRREYSIQIAGRMSNIADFIIEDRILVELKRKPTNTGDDYRQIMRYLESANIKLGILVNFGLEYLKPKRILNSKIDYSPNSRTFVDSRYGIHLVFVGDGALRPELENYAETIMRNTRMRANIANIKNNEYKNSYHSLNSRYGIHFVGFKNQTELPEFYARADIFVLPSRIGETWGLVVNEAMCFGLPIIISDIVGCGPDLVKEGQNGYIFPTGDIEKLIQYLDNLIGDSKKRKSFGEKSFEIIQDYDYEKDIQGILMAFKK